GTLLAELAGHRDLVWTAAFSSDGRRVVTASSDNTALVWDVTRTTWTREQLLAAMDAKLAALGRRASAAECQLYFSPGTPQRPAECGALAAAGAGPAAAGASAQARMPRQR
ncbi:MAG: hypothetical protein RLZZ584_4162, partial [Pseudomonadota bacterium]